MAFAGKSKRRKVIGPRGMWEPYRDVRSAGMEFSVAQRLLYNVQKTAESIMVAISGTRP